MQILIGCKCRVDNAGVMCSNVTVLVRTLAAAFWTT